jgi:uncharacterized protein (PEP-CTERM system associated)
MGKLQQAIAGAAQARHAPVALLTLLLAPTCHAELKVTPGVELRETYSDNVRLEANGLARSQFVSDLAPSLSIASDSPRLKLQASVGANVYAYSDRQIEGTNGSARQLQANAKASLIDELLFVDGAAAVGRQSISAFGPQATSGNGYSSTNQTEVRSWHISPYLSHRFGSTAVGELRYVRDAVTTSALGFGHSDSNTVSLSIGSGEGFRRFGWKLAHRRNALNDSITHRSNVDTSMLNLSYRLSETLSLTSSGGYDKYDYQALGGVTRGNSYSLGFHWTPSSRTNLEVSAGHQYFGKSYSLNALHRSRGTVWNLAYSTAVTSTRSQFLLPAALNTAAMLDRLFSSTIADPAARQQAVDAYIRATGLPATLNDSVNYLSNRYMLQKQLLGSFALNTARTTMVLSATASRRTALSVQQSDSALLGSSLANLNDNTRQTGASASLNYRISPRSGLNLSAGVNRNESLSTGLKDNNKSVRLSLTRQFLSKLKGSVEVRRIQGTLPLAGARNYRENAISATLSMQL